MVSGDSTDHGHWHCPLPLHHHISRQQHRSRASTWLLGQHRPQTPVWFLVAAQPMDINMDSGGNTGQTSPWPPVVTWPVDINKTSICSRTIDPDMAHSGSMDQGHQHGLRCQCGHSHQCGRQYGPWISTWHQHRPRTSSWPSVMALDGSTDHSINMTSSSSTGYSQVATRTMDTNMACYGSTEYGCPPGLWW